MLLTFSNLWKQCDLCLQSCPCWLIKQLTVVNGYYKQFSVQTWRNVAHSGRDAKPREKLKIEIKACINKIGVGEWLHSLLPVGVFATTWAPIGQEVMYGHMGAKHPCLEGWGCRLVCSIASSLCSFSFMSAFLRDQATVPKEEPRLHSTSQFLICCDQIRSQGIWACKLKDWAPSSLPFFLPSLLSSPKNQNWAAWFLHLFSRSFQFNFTAILQPPEQNLSLLSLNMGS